MSAEDTAASIAGAVVAGKALQVPTAELRVGKFASLKKIVMCRFYSNKKEAACACSVAAMLSILNACFV